MNNGKAIQGTTSKRKDMAAFSKAYLVLYNSVQTAGWSYMLFKTLKYLALRQTVNGLWRECGPCCILFQSLAILEVLHCILGFVPGSVLITAIQVFSRLFMVWGIVIPVKEAQITPTLPIMLTAWGVAEVVRYSYYCCHLIGTPPKLLTWCRYSFFMGLYPTGVIGEIGTIYSALNTIKRNRLFSIALPNKFNVSFNFYYLCLFTLACYVPLFPPLFGHMLRQRRKVLGRTKDDTVEKKMK